jgi:hypothetical protein
MAQCAHPLPLGTILFDCALKQLQVAIDNADDHVQAATIQPTVCHTRARASTVCLQLGVCILAVHCQPGACVAMLQHDRFGSLIDDYMLHVHDDKAVSDVQQRVYAVLQLLCTNALFASCIEHKFSMSTAIREVCVLRAPLASECAASTNAIYTKQWPTVTHGREYRHGQAILSTARARRKR